MTSLGQKSFNNPQPCVLSVPREGWRVWGGGQEDRDSTEKLHKGRREHKEDGGWRERERAQSRENK